MIVPLYFGFLAFQKTSIKVITIKYNCLLQTCSKLYFSFVIIDDMSLF
jgi:hypothetical protein